MEDHRQRMEPVVVNGGPDLAPEYESFADFYSTNSRPIATALMLTLRDRQLARDAAAEGMARAFQHWTKVSRYGNPAGWAYRAGLNWATSRLRKFRRESPADAATAEALGIAPGTVKSRLNRAVAVLRSKLGNS